MQIVKIMALGNAISFVKNFISDKDFRNKCNSLNTKSEIFDNYGFNETEFEDAINMQLVKCQTYEEAEYYHQTKMWFSIF